MPGFCYDKAVRATIFHREIVTLRSTAPRPASGMARRHWSAWAYPFEAWRRDTEAVLLGRKSPIRDDTVSGSRGYRDTPLTTTS